MNNPKNEKYGPLVSVVVPNYNYARFLKKRMDTILQQSLQDFEVIFLDDASTDSSLAVLEPYLQDRRIRVLVNQKNSGNPFLQWQKGISAARGKYIWIAEADDFADPDFLKALTAPMQRNPRIVIAYCQSLLADENQAVSGDMRGYTDSRWPGRWNCDFVNSGTAEIANFLSYKNTIPNASAVIMRSAAVRHAGFAAEGFRYCGDWITYVSMLRNGDICFLARPLNYFRTHTGSVRSGLANSALLVRERYQVLAYIKKYFQLPRRSLSLALESRMYLWLVFMRENGLRFNDPAVMQIREAARAVDPRLKWRFLKKSTGFWLKSVFQAADRRR